MMMKFNQQLKIVILKIQLIHFGHSSDALWWCENLWDICSLMDGKLCKIGESIILIHDQKNIKNTYRKNFQQYLSFF